MLTMERKRTSLFEDIADYAKMADWRNRQTENAMNGAK